jgi:PilZ domain
MLGERRRDQRRSINRTAKFSTDSGALPRDCMITDISKLGARIFADEVDVPDRFMLSISGDEAIRRECKVVWRLGGEIGVEFTPRAIAPNGNHAPGAKPNGHK